MSGGRIHRSIVKHTAILLLFAIVVTALIAWTCAWLTPDAVRPHYSMSGVPGAIAQWVEPVPDDWPNAPVGSTVVVPLGSGDITLDNGARVRLWQGMGLGVGVNVEPTGRVVVFDGGPNFVLDQIRVGWPVHTMVHRGPDDARPEAPSFIGRWYVNGLPIPGQPDPSRRLPLRPIWTPFLLAMLATAATLELLWQAWRMPGRVRTRRRRAQGRCLACGYDLAGMEQCPECGSPAANHAARSC